MPARRGAPPSRAAARRPGRLTAAVAAAVALSAPAALAPAGPAAARTVARDATDPPADRGPRGDFEGTVPLPGGRRIHVECRGTGTPTVVLVSGARGAADEWTHAADPAHPGAAPVPSASAVLPAVASFTRVCAYDRPGTTRFDDTRSPSTAVPQPTTAADGVADLRAVLAAAGEHGPYVLVGASWGAMITALAARAGDPRVAGLVTVDGASTHLRDTLTPAQWSDWTRKVDAMRGPEGLEVPDYTTSVAQIRAAPPLARPLPAVVLSSDEPWDLRVGDSGSTWPAWTAAQNRLAAELRARHVSDTDSGHGIAVEQPRTVTNAVREVVDRVRDGHGPGRRAHAPPADGRDPHLRPTRPRDVPG
ncbi:alpha/beta hydrolase [Streptomyces virginiae]|uniref:alpha/beta fold hydrolase n=1 Tax=Streptomyces TaxID=1883 RepID=UPI0006B010D2|nr:MULTISPECIES: alpha/beta hydrolase [unclassified Streptomyces]